MKKLSHKRINWLNYCVKRQHAKLIKEAIALKRAGKNMIVRRKSSVFIIPEILMAEKEEQRKRILEVVNQIWFTLENTKARIKLDFSKVNKIYPGGMLILISSLELICFKFHGRVVARCPSGSLAGQLLNHFGFAKNLGMIPSLNSPTADSVINWNYITGTQADGQKVSNLLKQYGDNTNAQIPQSLFAVLTEALVNVRQHAYEESDIHSDFQKWWLFARYREPSVGNLGNLYIAIYDIGVGIPFTMRRKKERKEIVIDFFDQAGKKFNLSNGTLLDKHLLSEAVENKRSQTGEPYRGNGLPEMREFVSSTTDGRLCIISGKAQYTSFGGQSHGQSHSIQSMFPGTLLLWSLPLIPKDSQL